MSLARCWGRVTNLTMKSAKGCFVYDTEGKKYLDLTSGIAVVNTGHCHPHIVKAIQKQAEEFIHCQVNCHYSETLVNYCKRLEKHMPAGIDTFFFCNSGAEAIEGASKLIRAHTRRMNILAMNSAFHGRTATAMTLTSSGSKYTSPCFPAQPNIHHCERPTLPEDVESCIKSLDLKSRGNMAWDSVAGVLIEPIQGEGGFHKMPVEWMEHLKARCEDSGALLVADEIQSGFGRCGKMFGFEYYPNAAPDVVVFGKGVAGGMPFAGFAASKKVMDSLEPSMHGGTYGGNPVAAAAANAVLDIMEDPAFLANANRQAERFLAAIEKYPSLLNPRATGMMVAFDMPSKEAATEFTSHMLQKHSIIFFAPCGIEGTTLRVMPPLTITDEETDMVVAALDETCKALYGSQ
eukprot:TRINITY_DN4719_c0_g1_i1.p1 TRINITY_DN4719_c0_g1~~TRINITY_DN4719_c0_g1_i1.p1  ORF type:complete len:426 (+),score=112.56 TRINITY_DN4719_c0_g1_i1:65-1279(+)